MQLKLELELRLKWETWLQLVRVIQHNRARSYEWTITALEIED